MAVVEITAYVQCDTLFTYDTAEPLRLATPTERRESYADARGPGAIVARVSIRTLRRRAPRLWSLDSQGRDW